MAQENFPQDAHPAAQANIKSFAAAASGNKEEWLALFADNAVVEDPVGVSDLDPVGNGHKGKEAIGNFWDTMIAPGKVSFEVKQRLPRANECAVLAVVNNDMGAGTLQTEMIVVYRVNTEGKIESLRAFWHIEAAMEKMGG